MPSARPRLAIIWLTIFIDLVGFGIVIPILPFYSAHFGAHGIGYGALIGAFSLMQFFSTALLGRLSDRIGRRPILLGTMVLNAAGYLLFAFAPSFLVLLIARLIAGFAGGNISAAQAYVADITVAEERSKGMGLIGMAFGLGFIFGPAIGSMASRLGGHAAPGLVAAGLSIVNLLSAYFILPESLRAEHRAVRELWPFRHMAVALVHPELRPLMLVWAITPFAFAAYTVALPLWATATLHWQEPDLGIFFTVVGLVAAIVQGGVFRLLTRVITDRKLLITGMLGMAWAIAVVPFLAHSATLYAWTVVLAFSNSIMAPAATGLVSTFAGANEQGTVLGVAQSLGALGRFMGPFVIGVVYDRASAMAAFLVAGGVMLIGWVASLGVPKTKKREQALLDAADAPGRTG
ncbi:MAG TPA: MFS transporter [Gemmatimonadales bacterium]|nr:MFS transporter [Gemmatimonadales bacterium]